MVNPPILVFGGIAIGVGLTVVTALAIAPSITEWAIRRNGPRLLSRVIPGGFVTVAAATPIANVLAPLARDEVRDAVTPW